MLFIKNVLIIYMSYRFINSNFTITEWEILRFAQDDSCAWERAGGKQERFEKIFLFSQS